MHLFSPQSRSDAIELILAHRPRPETPGQRALFTQQSLDRLFDREQRAAERVWAVRGDDPGTSGLVAGRLIGDVALIDMLALPDDDAAAALVLDAATVWARSTPDPALSFETDTTLAPLTDPTVARIVDLAGRVGWRVHVTRRHYRLPADSVAAASAAMPLSVDLERAGPADRDRLVDLLSRVLPGSLDVRDRELVARKGLAAAAAAQADDLLEADPLECIRFATEAGTDVGFASWLGLDSGRSYVIAVGVAEQHRGRGLGGELVAAATRDLIAAGSDTLIADTDDVNIGMIRGFARSGWHPTQARIDLTLGRPV